jgi:hypothetical protein
VRKGICKGLLASFALTFQGKDICLVLALKSSFDILIMGEAINQAFLFYMLCRRLEELERTTHICYNQRIFIFCIHDNQSIFIFLASSIPLVKLGNENAIRLMSKTSRHSMTMFGFPVYKCSAFNAKLSDQKTPAFCGADRVRRK